MAERLVQEVRIPMKSPNGEDWGLLRLGASSKEHFPEIDRDFAQYKNVPMVTSPSASHPIEYCMREPLAGLARTMLLEETNYDVVYKGPENSSVEIMPLLAGKEFREFVFGEKSWHKAGTLNFRSYVGRTWLSVTVDGQESERVPIEVRSKKLGYADEYVSMMGDLSQDCSALIYSLDSPVHQAFRFSDLKRETLLEDYLFLEYLFKPENLPTAYSRVRESPKSLLVKIRETVPIGYASSVGPNDLVAMVCDSGQLVQPASPPHSWPSAMRGYVPLEISQSRARETRDIPENRLVKFFLIQVFELATTLLEKSEQKIEKSGMEGIRARLSYFVDEVSGFLADDWLKDVGELTSVPLNSQTLLKRDGYREIFRFWRDFDFAFRFTWEALQDDVLAAEKRMHQLFEYWCFFRMVDALRTFATQKTSMNKLLQVSEDQWEIKLRRGFASRLQFEYFPVGGERVQIELFYNRGFSAKGNPRGSYSLPFRPDYTLVFHPVGNKEPSYCHFDAKYRSQDEFEHFVFEPKDEESHGSLEEDDFGTGEEQMVVSQKESEQKRKFKDADIYKMHTYKDAIFFSQGAYVLYPGDKVGLFRENLDISGEREIPSVGAFPLKPGNGANKTITLGSFIRRISQTVVKSSGGLTCPHI